MNEMRDILRLHREYLDELVKLRMLPYGQTMNYNPTGGKSSEPLGGKRPAGEARPDHEVFAEAWMRCRSVGERERVVREMREALNGWKKAKKPDKAEDPRALDREIQAKRGWTDREVADAMRLPVSKVHEARLAIKCCPAKGYPHVGVSVVDLADRGNSVRQIEAMTGVKYVTVHRMLKKAA